MNNKIKRVFINSTGRTGTQFFSENLNTMIDNALCVHEPGTPWLSKPKRLMKDIKDYGLFHITLGQTKNTHSMYKLSRDVIAGDISKSDAIRNIKQINDKVEHVNKKDILIYSSGHIYGLLDLLDEIYDDSRFIFIVRDPRTWIESALNKNEYTLYGPIEKIFSQLSLQANCIDDDPYAEVWHLMSKFEKYCWYYNKLNEIAITSMIEKSNFNIYRYEDIFLSKSRNRHFQDMLDFATNFDSECVKARVNVELLSQKVDQVKAKNSWTSWTNEQVRIMHKHCGKLMTAFEYGNEQEWCDRLGGGSN